MISHNTSDNKHWKLPNKHQIFNINGQGERCFASKTGQIIVT